jgi:hypothetical protein
MATPAFRSDLDLPPPTTDNPWDTVVYNRITKGITFSASNSTDQTIPTSTVTKLTFDTLEYDTRGQWDEDNNKYIIRNAGVYEFNLSAQFDISAAAISIYPSPPFVYSTNTTLVTADQNAININKATDFVAGMKIGVVCNVGVVANAYIQWMDLLSVDTGLGNLTFTSNFPGATYNCPVGAPIYGVAPPAAFPSTATTHLYLYKNGVEIAQTNISGANLHFPVCKFIRRIECDPNDYFEVYVDQSTGSSQMINANSNVTYFQVMRKN